MVRRPSPALVVACTALVVALGGTGYAATQLPPDSVGRVQIREGAVGSAQLRDGAIRAQDMSAGSVASKQVQDHSVRARDLASGVIPPRSTTAVRQSGGEAVAPGAVGAASVGCAAGERMQGGGGGFAGPPTTNDKVVDTLPVGLDGPAPRWRVSLFNGGTEPRTPVAYVICTR
jgi:hypothetical protein